MTTGNGESTGRLRAAREMAAAVRRRCAGEDGFTLVEVLVASVLMLVVAGAMVLFLGVSSDQQNAIASESYAAREAQTGLHQLEADLGDAMSENVGVSPQAPLSLVISMPSSSSTQLVFDIPTVGSDTTPTQVTWLCTGGAAGAPGSCTRKVGSGAAQPLITGLLSSTFTPQNSSGAAMTLSTTTPATNPSYVGITLKVQVTSQLDRTQTHQVQGLSTPILEQTGVDVRNFA